MSFIIANTITDCLIKAGWSPQRKINVLSLEKSAVEAGYTWFENASSFLSSFSGLKIVYNSPDNSEDVDFNVERAIRVLDPWWLFENYAVRIGKSTFCPIGLASNYHLLLFMSEDGCVYGCYDDFLALIAPSGLEAIENLLMDKNIIEIPE